MRKTRVLPLVLLGAVLLSSCGKSEVESASKTPSDSSGAVVCSEPFTVEGSGATTLSLKAKVLADNVRNVAANNGGDVTFLDCEKGKKVTAGTLVAKISPDLSDPNVKNLMNQRDAYGSQLSNTRDILVSTRSNYATQLNSLQIQKANLETQVSLLNDSLSKIQEQRKYGVSDIDKQLELLQIQLDTSTTQIADLKNSKAKLEDSKTADLAKLQINLANSRTQAKSLVSNALVQIDETYGITDKNREKNDAYDTYLGAKNEGLKNSVTSLWSSANATFMKFDGLSDAEVSTYLQSVGELLSKTKESVKSSIPASTFSQSAIDGLFSVFVQYENNVLTAKNGMDTVVKSVDTVRNTYDTQMLSLDTQIDGAENGKKSVAANVENVKGNKLGTYTSSLDVQLNQANAQIETARTNLSGVNSQIESVKSQEEIQINQLNNQISTLESGLATVSANLAPQTIYAEVEGTVKEKSAASGNKVAAGGTLCQILPDHAGLKMQAYSSYDLPLPSTLSFEADGKKYSTVLKTKLPYQDAVTQNSVYEAPSTVTLDGKPVDIASVLSEGRVFDVTVDTGGKQVGSSKTAVPIDYVSNTIGGSKVKVKTADGKVVEKEIVLGNLDSDTVEVKS
ncbi:MAG: hypothetical protein WA194_02625 [Patescibacteria group bacterium]